MKPTLNAEAGGTSAAESVAEFDAGHPVIKLPVTPLCNGDESFSQGLHDRTLTLENR